MVDLRAISPLWSWAVLVTTRFVVLVVIMFAVVMFAVVMFAVARVKNEMVAVTAVRLLAAILISPSGDLYLYVDIYNFAVGHTLCML